MDAFGSETRGKYADAQERVKRKSKRPSGMLVPHRTAGRVAPQEL